MKYASKQKKLMVKSVEIIKEYTYKRSSALIFSVYRRKFLGVIFVNSMLRSVRLSTSFIRCGAGTVHRT
jgi:hypothetical protein